MKVEIIFSDNRATQMFELPCLPIKGQMLEFYDSGDIYLYVIESKINIVFEDSIFKKYSVYAKYAPSNNR